MEVIGKWNDSKNNFETENPEKWNEIFNSLSDDSFNLEPFKRVIFEENKHGDEISVTLEDEEGNKTKELKIRSKKLSVYKIYDLKFQLENLFAFGRKKKK